MGIMVRVFRRVGIAAVNVNGDGKPFENHGSDFETSPVICR